MSIKQIKMANRSVTFALVLAIIVLFNLVSIQIFKNFRIDLTRGGAFTLSKVSKKVVANLEEPLRIRVFFSKNLPAPHSDTERYLKDLLNEYDRSGNKNFKYTFYDCTESKAETSKKIEKNLEIAKDYGINPVQIQKIEKDEVQVMKAYMGVVIQNGDMIERISPIEGTAGLEYQITGIIQKMNNKASSLLKLSKGAIKVKLYLNTSLYNVAPEMNINGLAEVPSRLKTIVEEANIQNFGKLEFSIHDYTSDPAIEKEVDKLGISKLQWGAFRSPRTGMNIAAGTGCAAMVIEYGGKVEKAELIKVDRIPFFGDRYSLADLNNYQETINGYVENLLDIGDKLGYLTGNGTLSTMDMSSNPYMRQMNPNAQDGEAAKFAAFLRENYSITEKSVGDLENTLPALVIAGAKETFSDYDLFKIDQYLMSGRSLIVFHDSLVETAPDQSNPYGGGMPTYLPNQSGLENLLAHYGVIIEKSYVMDTNCYVNMQRSPYGGGVSKQPIYFMPQINVDSINTKFPSFRNLKMLITSKMSPLTVDEKALSEKGIKATKLFSSSTSAWEMRDNIMLNPAYIQPPAADQMKSYPLAYVLEGEFTSYFVDKGIPEKTGEESTDAKNDKSLELQGNNTFIRQGKPGKIFVMGSTDLVKNQFLPDPNFPNVMFIQNVVDYMSGRTDWAVMRSKSQRFNPLKPDAKKMASFLKMFNGVGVPILVILAGIYVWYRRNIRRKKIQEIFQKY